MDWQVTPDWQVFEEDAGIAYAPLLPEITLVYIIFVLPCFIVV